MESLYIHFYLEHLFFSNCTKRQLQIQEGNEKLFPTNMQKIRRIDFIPILRIPTPIDKLYRFQDGLRFRGLSDIFRKEVVIVIVRDQNVICIFRLLTHSERIRINIPSRPLSLMLLCVNTSMFSVTINTSYYNIFMVNLPYSQ